MARFAFQNLRPLESALFYRLGTASVEIATRGRVYRAGHIALKNDLFPV